MSDEIEPITITKTEGGLLYGNFPRHAVMSPECLRYAPQLGIRFVFTDDYGNTATYRMTGFDDELNLVLVKEEDDAHASEEEALAQAQV